MATILLTRPQTVSAQLAKDLQRQGYKTIIEPLLTIAPTNIPRPATDAQAVMITSSNTLAALEENNENVGDLLHRPCFTVGPRTKNRAEMFGFTNVQTTNGDSDDLAHFIASNSKGPVLHIAGQDIDAKSHDALHNAAIEVSHWPVYTATPADTLSPHVISLIKKQEIDAVLLFSPRTAATLAKLISSNALEACCKSLIAIGLSEAVIDPLRPLNWRQLLAAPVPTEDAVITCLNAALPV
ncbi:MAG TPA: uroporphyrinogen-III synthase [Alphaproteobacteria bacterium]|nr:uroporphyrinogen-III synthase [Alphaproteobacteria bacterium]